jgi:hypothetical protein
MTATAAVQEKEACPGGVPDVFSAIAKKLRPEHVRYGTSAISRISSDLWVEVLAWLPWRFALSLATTSSLFRYMLQNQVLWRKYVHRELADTPSKIPKQCMDWRILLRDDSSKWTKPLATKVFNPKVYIRLKPHKAYRNLPKKQFINRSTGEICVKDTSLYAVLSYDNTRILTHSPNGGPKVCCAGRIVQG